MTDPGSFVCVMPSIWREWTDACCETLDRSILDRAIVVDNTVHNRGWTASVNDGVRAMFDRDCAWTVILSAGMRFGQSRGLDFFGNLAAFDGDIAVEADSDIGWHLIAVSREAFERAGLLDESFMSHYSDNDLSRRIQLAYGRFDPPFWRKVPIDAYLLAAEHSITLGGYRAGPEDRLCYIAKWGGEPGHELWDHPYGDPIRPVSYWVKT